MAHHLLVASEQPHQPFLVGFAPTIAPQSSSSSPSLCSAASLPPRRCESWRATALTKTLIVRKRDIKPRHRSSSPSLKFRAPNRSADTLDDELTRHPVSQALQLRSRTRQFLRKAERSFILFIINHLHSSSGIQMPVSREYDLNSGELLMPMAIQQKQPERGIVGIKVRGLSPRPSSARIDS